MRRSLNDAGRLVEILIVIIISMLTLWQILENHSSQIQHLSKELESLAKEFMEWEEGQNSRLNAQR